MKNFVNKILIEQSRHIQYIKNKITFEIDHEGKSAFNFEINKLYKSKQYNIDQKQFHQIIANCYVIIQRMRSLPKNDWSISELEYDLFKAIRFSEWKGFNK